MEETTAVTCVKELRNLLGEYPRSPCSSFDKVYPGIYLGGLNAAKDVESLRKTGITHVVNAAYDETGGNFLYIEPNEEYYASMNFKCTLLGIPAADVDSFPLHLYFKQTADFIDSAIKSNGKVLVHCFQGVSRSATLIITYLMMKESLSAVEAVTLVRKRRKIYPNDGFLQQICDLEVQLRS